MNRDEAKFVLKLLGATLAVLLLAAAAGIGTLLSAAVAFAAIALAMGIFLLIFPAPSEMQQLEDYIEQERIECLRQWKG